jgi:tetratricopeptide (TPR) repeat protein
MKRGKIPILGLLAMLAYMPPLHAASDAAVLYKAGNDAKSVEDFYSAIEKYKAAIDANPDYSLPMIGLAECFLFLEEYDEAAKWAAKATAYTREDTDLMVLDARIRIGLGDVKSARTILSRVLSKLPNHLEARFASAEADIAEGRVREALDAYIQTLKLAPESRKALLSLAILSDETGDPATASRYFDIALRSHSADPRVQLAAAGWYAGSGKPDLAEKHARIALSLKPDLYSAQVLLGGVLTRTGRYSEAIEAFRAVVAAERLNPLAWYGLGLAYAKAGDPERAISSYKTGLSVAPEDELMRLAQEYAALDSLKMDEPRRQALGAFHADLGAQLLIRNFQDKSLVEYRRALILDPTSETLRISYAKIWKAMGFPAKYLNELEVAAKLGSKNTVVSDEIESLTSGLSESVSRRWGIDQFALDRRRYTIPVFAMDPRTRLLHPMASDFLLRYFTDTILRYDAVSLPPLSPSIQTVEEAFRKARETGSDYFIVLSLDESERSFSAAASLHLSRTGERIASYNAFRTGNDRIRDCFMKIAGQISAALPLRGTLLVRRFDLGLLDLGSLSGVKKDDVLTIVRKDKVRLDPVKPGLLYDDADVLGSFTVGAVDEGSAEGKVSRKGYFDYINAGDEVVFAPAKPAAAPVAPSASGGNILTRLFGLPQ